MKRFFFILLLALIQGCVTEPETRNYEHYTKAPEFDSYIQGDGYKLWYDKEFFEQLKEVEKDSNEWKLLQKLMNDAPLDKAFRNSETGLMAVICKFRHKIPYDQTLKLAKKSSGPAIVKTDQRIVNNKLVLYIVSAAKKYDTKTMVSTYFINAKSGSLLFMIGCREENYEKYGLIIQKALNGIEVD